MLSAPEIFSEILQLSKNTIGSLVRLSHCATSYESYFTGTELDNTFITPQLFLSFMERFRLEHQDNRRTQRRQLELSWAVSGMHLLSTVYELGGGLQRGELRVTVDLWWSLLCSPWPPAFPGPRRPVHATSLHRFWSFCNQANRIHTCEQVCIHS